MGEITLKMENELYHNGILGMRWGVRRSKSSGSGSSGTSNKRKLSSDAESASTLKKKKVGEMSNAELRQINERQQLERTHSQLNKGAIVKGLAYAATVLTVANTIVNLTDKGGKVIDIGKSAGNKVVDTIGNVVVKDINKHL